jgi:tryptophan synthase alpha chain
MQLQNPCLIGFGVHNKETFETVSKYSRGAIIGSAFIKNLTEFGTSKSVIADFLKGIRG